MMQIDTIIPTKNAVVQWAMGKKPRDITNLYNSLFGKPNKPRVSRTKMTSV
jgi:hypothetical protein